MAQAAWAATGPRRRRRRRPRAAHRRCGHRYRRPSPGRSGPGRPPRRRRAPRRRRHVAPAGRRASGSSSPQARSPVASCGQRSVIASVVSRSAGMAWRSSDLGRSSLEPVVTPRQPEDAGPDEQARIELQPLLERSALPCRVVLVGRRGGARRPRLVTGAGERVAGPVLVDQRDRRAAAAKPARGPRPEDAGADDDDVHRRIVARSTITSMEGTPSTAAISTRALTKHYGTVDALTDLSSRFGRARSSDSSARTVPASRR